jgi:hypothetical protein
VSTWALAGTAAITDIAIVSASNRNLARYRWMRIPPPFDRLPRTSLFACN